jgi:hypothetical protein
VAPFLLSRHGLLIIRLSRFWSRNA